MEKRVIHGNEVKFVGTEEKRVGKRSATEKGEVKRQVYNVTNYKFQSGGL